MSVDREAQAKELLRMIAEHGLSLRKACDKVGIALTTASDMLNGQKYAEQYARAREERAIFLAEEGLEIVDGPGEPADKRLRYDARRWYASKLFPRYLGDKVTTAHEGNIGVAITKIENVVIDPED